MSESARKCREVLDFSHFAAYAPADPGLEAEMVGLFRDGAQQLLVQLAQDLAQGAGRDWNRHLHTLKGLALTMGAGVLAQRAGAAEVRPPAQSALSGLRAAMAECESALRQRGH